VYKRQRHDNGFWNGLVYAVFGYGTTVGALGMHNTTVFGPEIGFVGLGLNVAFAAVLWLGVGRAMQTLVVPAPLEA